MKKVFSAMILMVFYVCMVSAEGIIYTANPSKRQRGIVILPLAEIDSSNAALSRVMQQKQQGYVDKEFNDAKELLAIGRNYASLIDDNANPIDTHMKSDLSKIKLAFTFTPPSVIKPIGFAVGGMYIKNLGWTSITTFFNEKNSGTCDYTRNHMKLARGAVFIPKETLRYDVNHKVTSVFAEGSQTSGFMYHVSWDDETYNHFLGCANRMYDKNILHHMIELARTLDKAV